MTRPKLLGFCLAGLIVAMSFSEVRAGGSRTVAAGTISCDYAGLDDTLYSYDAYGPHDYQIYSGSDNLAAPVLDLGAYRWVGSVMFTNFSFATNYAIAVTQVYVAAHEETAISDGVQISDFDFAASDAAWPLPATNEAGAVRTLGLNRQMYCRYLKIVTTQNIWGGLSSGNPNFMVGELDVSGTAPTHAVTAGSVNTLGGRDALVAHPEFGTYAFAAYNSDGDGVIRLVVDLGSAQFMSRLQITNPNFGTNYVPGAVRCLVAADESALGFDPQLLGSYTQEVGSGYFLPIDISAGAVRSLDFGANVMRRYLLVEISSNAGAELNPTIIGDMAVTAHAVTAGTVQPLGGDTLVAHPEFGTYGFAAYDAGDSVIRLLVDQGSAKLIDMLQITNRTDGATNYVPRAVRCLVAADENASGFDPQAVGSYTQEIGAGNLTPFMNLAGALRSLDLTNVTRRYLLLEISSNIGAEMSPTLMADIAFVVPPASVNAADYGYNATDATDALQAAICTRAAVVQVPNLGTNWIVRPIYLAENQEIVFADGVTVIAKRGEFHDMHDCLFSGMDLANVKLTGTNATFQMWKSDYADIAQYSKSEFRHGINLEGCSQVTISGITVKETGGDGIFVGSSYPARTPPCSHIVIRNVVCDRNYRQGMSVCSVDDLTVENCIFRATSGTAPQAGIDFEPNTTDEILSNITLKNCIFEGNNSYGVTWVTQNMANPRDYSAVIENCTFYGNKSNGLQMEYASSQLTVTDCLFVGNLAYGVRNSDAVTLALTYDAFWANSSGAKSGPVTLGTGCLTTIQPVFASTTFGDANYMYLASGCPAAITAGASDGGFLGARPKVAAPQIPGDANHDNKVDVSDLGILAANYGTTVGATWEQGDFNGDHKVDVSDLGILAANYGTGTGTSLDFNADAKAMGLLDEVKAETTSSPGCGSAGLPLIAGLFLAAGLLLAKLNE